MGEGRRDGDVMYIHTVICMSQGSLNFGEPIPQGLLLRIAPTVSSTQIKVGTC